MSKQVKILLRITFYFIENKQTSVSSSSFSLCAENFDYFSLSKRKNVKLSTMSYQVDLNASQIYWTISFARFLNYLNWFSQMKWNNNNSYRIKNEKLDKCSLGTVYISRGRNDIKFIRNNFKRLGADIRSRVFFMNTNHFVHNDKKNTNRSGMK